MFPDLDHLPGPAPDVERFKAVLRREKPDRIPLVELMIDDTVLKALAGRPLAPLMHDPTVDQLREWASDRIALWHRLGYDYFRLRAEIPFAVHWHKAQSAEIGDSAQITWVDESSGPIQTREDFEQFPWPTDQTIDMSSSEVAIELLPEGMDAIGFSGGVLEWASELLGLQNFAIALYDEPQLVKDVVGRVGEIIFAAFRRFCEMDRVFAIWLGDDMGFKTSTLISPDHLRELILPWHKKYAELAHASGRFFLLHSCGKISAVMPDLVNDVGIDAKHSFEDIIEPVERFYSRWHERTAVLGGVDVDLLSRGTPDEVRRRTREILESCSDGGYACGSGNSITGYVSAQNYLAMIETVREVLP
jgi:uroporphyrinogen decarboxylase